MDRKYRAEPYRIKMVEAIKETTRHDREEALKRVGYNVFAIKSDDVYIDLLTDSGTGAMSDAQWGAMMIADEAYAGSRSYYRLKAVVEEITGYHYLLPVHQGRGAEQVLMGSLIHREGMVFISNSHFDTTRAHVELAGARALDCVIEAAFDTQTPHPFKGNFDVAKLERLILEKGPENIAGIIYTITNNSMGGQPVSLENLTAVSKIAKKYGILRIMDGARYAENAFFIQQREAAYCDWTIQDIARAQFDLADVFMMSAKKDGLVNMGGLLVIKDNQSLFEACQVRVVPMEGFPTYGGMSGRAMDALAVGLKEALEVPYLTHRTDQIRYLADRLQASGIPVQTPPGGHAVFIDAKAWLPHIPQTAFPAQSVVIELYLEAGIRAVEIGSFLLGNDPDTHEPLISPTEFVRLTIPRRTYTYRHLDDVADALSAIHARKETLKGLKVVKEPAVLRHFTAQLAYLD